MKVLGIRIVVQPMCLDVKGSYPGSIPWRPEYDDINGLVIERYCPFRPDSKLSMLSAEAVDEVLGLMWEAVNKGDGK